MQTCVYFCFLLSVQSEIIFLLSLKRALSAAHTRKFILLGWPNIFKLPVNLSACFFISGLLKLQFNFRVFFCFLTIFNELSSVSPLF